MSGGNRKVNRTRKVGGNRSRKVVGRSRKMVGGAFGKSKAVKQNKPRKSPTYLGPNGRWRHILVNYPHSGEKLCPMGKKRKGKSSKNSINKSTNKSLKHLGLQLAI